MSNPAITAALIAANASRRNGQEAVLAQLKTAGAFGPATAVRLELEGAEAVALTELTGLAIVRPLGSGRYYLDRDRQRERSAQQGWVAIVILLGIASVMASFIALASL
jgi:hypothetical protein